MTCHTALPRLARKLNQSHQSGRVSRAATADACESKKRRAFRPAALALALAWFWFDAATLRSSAVKASACSLGKKSWSLLPSKSLREYPNNNSPARLNMLKRKSLVRFEENISS